MTVEEKIADLICLPPKPVVTMFLGYYSDDVNFEDISSNSTKAMNAYVALRYVLVTSSLFAHGKNALVTTQFVMDVKEAMAKLLSRNNPYNINLDKIERLEDDYVDAAQIFGDSMSLKIVKNTFFNSLPYVPNEEQFEKIFMATGAGIEHDMQSIMGPGCRAARAVAGSGCLLPIVMVTISLGMFFLVCA